MGGIFCDLKKVFDCVDHEILLTKMYNYGISNKELKLITSYLQDRNQRVIISSRSKYCSEWESIKQGVPRGSVLGPLLFLIYINDLPQMINTLADPILFADDTSMSGKCTMVGRSGTVSTSSFEMNNTGNIDKDNCAKCSDCELQLKEALEELSSAHKIIEILQTELQVFKTSSTTCDKGQLSSSKKSHRKSTSDICTPSSHNDDATKQYLARSTWADKIKTSLNP